MTIVGLDIGGANLKASRPDGSARSSPFALWKRPDDLTSELAKLLGDWLPADRFAVTMTGELCDCFADRSDGVRHILRSVAALTGPAGIRIWRTDGGFASIGEAFDDPLPAASANWLALAFRAAHEARAASGVNGSAIVLDIGSTTTDIIPLMNGRPTPTARTDADRIRSRELVYTGVRRTPVCALMEIGEGMAEFFATTLDVHLILGAIPEDTSDCDTADGRPATRLNAQVRLARMLGQDGGDMRPLAERIAERQQRLVQEALAVVAARIEPVQTVVICGQGEFLGRSAVASCLPEVGIVSLCERLGPETSTAGCAYAVATLLHESES